MNDERFRKLDLCCQMKSKKRLKSLVHPVVSSFKLQSRFGCPIHQKTSHEAQAFSKLRSLHICGRYLPRNALRTFDHNSLVIVQWLLLSSIKKHLRTVCVNHAQLVDICLDLKNHVAFLLSGDAVGVQGCGLGSEWIRRG